VIFAGLSNLFEGGAHDRDNLILPGEQDKLIREIAKANPNTVVVLINGTPVSMPWIDDVKAVLEAYYPGQEGGNAIANVLFGMVNPSGKLPETFPVRLEIHLLEIFRERIMLLIIKKVSMLGTGITIQKK
jgi:beta-glucosidase